MNDNSSTALRAPQKLLDDIVSLKVNFFDFDGIAQEGVVEVHKNIEQDICDLFECICDIKFPLVSVQPVSLFDYSDDLSMAANNTSAFNFRTVALDPSRISNHGYGLAIDINPVQNPYIKGEVTLPPNANYRKKSPGTLTADHPITLFMKERGFIWGGDWNKSYLDYQHFHKELSVKLEEKYQDDVQGILDNLGE